MIRTKSGISGKMIVEAVSKSRATVMRALAALKLSGEIVYRGSKKTGGYYLQSISEKGIIRTVEKKASDILALVCVIFGGTGLCVASNYAVHSCSIPPPHPIVATSGVKPFEPYSRADLSAACSDNNLQSNFAAFNTDCKAHSFVKREVFENAY